MEFVEEVGESSSPPRSFGSFEGGGGGNDVIRNDVYNRLLENGNEEAINNPDFRDQLEAHFNRLPPSYVLDINMDRVEDVLLHQKLLTRAKDPDNQPAFHISFLESVGTSGHDFDGEQISSAPSVAFPRNSINNGVHSSNDRNSGGDFETCSKLEDLNLDVMKNSSDVKREVYAEDFIQREEASNTPIHEIIFSTVDKPKLLSQLSALLSDVGLNIREAHVFSTTDGYSLDVFVVDGWHSEDTEGLYNFMRKAIAESQKICYAIIMKACICGAYSLPYFLMDGDGDDFCGSRQMPNPVRSCVEEAHKPVVSEESHFHKLLACI